MRTLHLALYAVDRAFVACPSTACDAVVHVPEQHLRDVSVAVCATVYHHAEAAVYHFAPAYAATVVQRHPCSAAERVADDVLHSHVGAELRTVVYVACLAERRVGARHVVMVASEHDGSGYLALAYSLVER